MLFSVSLEHKTFFEKNHFIEFEEVFSTKICQEIETAAQSALAKKLQVPLHKLGEQTSGELFNAGYLLSLLNNPLKQFCYKPALASIISLLTNEPAIRFGFDQYLLSSKTGKTPDKDPASLETSSCLSPLVGGVILVLQDRKEPINTFPLPVKAGHALFISTTLPIPWSEILSQEGLSLLFIGFGKEKTFFKAGTADPLAFELKKQGYGFNDQLKDPIHPLLKRK